MIWKSEKEGTSSPAMAAIKDLFRESLEDYNPKQELNLTILHQIVLGLTVLDLRTQLSLTTAGIDTCDSIGRTPLMWATARSDLDAMRLLLDFSANIEIPDPYNRNVFHIAGRYGSSEALKLLLQYIVNSPVPENMERDAYYARLLNRPDIYENTPLCQTTFACRTNHSLLLLEFPCTINPPSPEQSPLLAAIQSNDHEVVKRLLAKGGRTDVVDEEKMSILHFAAQFGDLETISTLLRHQDPPLKVNAVSVDLFGNTPMQSFHCMRRKYRISYTEEDEESFARCREAFESLLNKVNSSQLELH